LCEMTNIGLPVPPGFTITTEACNEYYANGEKVPEGTWDQVWPTLPKVGAIFGKITPEPSIIKVHELIDKINLINELITFNPNEILEKKDIKKINKLIGSTLNQINYIYKFNPKIYIKIVSNPEICSKIIILKSKKIELKEILRNYRKLNIIKAKLAIVKAKSFLKRMFDSLGEFSKKAVAIYAFCRIILDIVDHINKLVHKKKSRYGSFLF